MGYTVAASAGLLTLVLGYLPANATSPAPSLQLDIGQAVERADSEAQIGIIDAIVTDSDQPLVDEDRDAEALSIEPGAPSEAWSGNDDAAGVTISLTDDISLGLDYELEELEELTADRIEMGAGDADHESHNVMLRANWRFDLKP